MLCIYATIILVAAGTVGQVILDAIGIHMHSLKVAGGIILFLFGVQMLFGKMDEKAGSSPEEGRDLAVFPLAVPSIAGPGAMMAVIVLTDNDVYTVPERLETGVVLLVVLFLTYLLLLFSDAILRVIGRQGASVLVRVMGLILCSLAVEIVLTALGVGRWTAVRRTSVKRFLFGWGEIRRTGVLFHRSLPDRQTSLSRANHRGSNAHASSICRW